MDQITNIKDEYLIMVVNMCSISSMELLSTFEYNSVEWLLHTSGLAYGVWTSICDPSCISLEDVDNLLNEVVMSHLN
jgi:hypothetical protein